MAALFLGRRWSRIYPCLGMYEEIRTKVSIGNPNTYQIFLFAWCLTWTCIIYRTTKWGGQTYAPTHSQCCLMFTVPCRPWNRTSNSVPRTFSGVMSWEERVKFSSWPNKEGTSRKAGPCDTTCCLSTSFMTAWVKGTPCKETRPSKISLRRWNMLISNLSPTNQQIVDGGIGPWRFLLSAISPLCALEGTCVNFNI